MPPSKDDDEGEQDFGVDDANGDRNGTGNPPGRLKWDRFSRSFQSDHISSSVAVSTLKSCCKDAFLGRECTCGKKDDNNAMDIDNFTSSISASASAIAEAAASSAAASADDNAAVFAAVAAAAADVKSDFSSKKRSATLHDSDADTSPSQKKIYSSPSGIQSLLRAMQNIAPTRAKKSNSASQSSSQLPPNVVPVDLATTPTPATAPVATTSRIPGGAVSRSLHAMNTVATQMGSMNTMASQMQALRATNTTARRSRFFSSFMRPNYSGHPSETFFYEAPDVKALPTGLENVSDIADANSVCIPIGTSDPSLRQQSCLICLESLASALGSTSESYVPSMTPVALKACSCRFHLQCIQATMRQQTGHLCPLCRTSILSSDGGDGNYKLLQGNMPSASMICQRPTENAVSLDAFGASSCSGYENCGTIIITYCVASARQRSYHPNPGQYHDPTRRVAYLPDNREGRELLSRLKFAFLRGLIFTVGTSLTTNRPNSVTWASIHHKTSRSGGTQRRGYPDESYFSNCNSELDAVGVPSAQICSNYVAKHKPHPILAAIKNASGSFYSSENSILLFHLLHAEHCKHAPKMKLGESSCSIIEACDEFKKLREHVKGCADQGCALQFCSEAKRILKHYNDASCNVSNTVNSDGRLCEDCGHVRSAIEGAKVVGDDIGIVRLQDLCRYTGFTTLSTKNLQTNFFFDQDIQSVFQPRNHKGLGDCPIAPLLKTIKSNDFLDFIKSHGFEGVSVGVNPNFSSNKPEIYRSFVDEGVQLATGTKDENDGMSVRIVFHGTSVENISSILSHGLDPQRRRGQVYGQGEYFGSSPSMSLGYCRGGRFMLVFAVITAKTDVRAKDIVVVRKSQRQLPIAMITFDNSRISDFAWSTATSFQRTINMLEREKSEKEKIAKEARDKEKIVRLILKNEYFSASEFYNKACEKNAGKPPESWAEEVASYVHDHMRDDEQVEIYFPNLPPRPANAADVTMLNVSKCEEEAKIAKRKYEEKLKQSKVSSKSKSKSSMSPS